MGKEKAIHLEKIGLGGGCHWCTEGIFQMLRGIAEVDQGFIRSHHPADTWAEAITVRFDPTAISLATLVDVHLRTHSATATFRATSKYRSAIYVFDDWQRWVANDAIATIQTEFSEPIETRVLAFEAFKRSDDRFRNFYATDPSRPFCRRYIDPKRDFVRKTFGNIAIERAQI